MQLVPIGAVSYSNSNLFGTLQRLTGKFQMHQWNDRCGAHANAA
jgi:hypothetical protein